MIIVRVLARISKMPVQIICTIIFGYYTPKIKIDVQTGVFRKLPVQKTDRTGPG